MATPYNLAEPTTPPNADYLTAAISAVVGLTANTAVEALYLWGQYDYKMDRLTGEKKYTMTLPADFRISKSFRQDFGL